MGWTIRNGSDSSAPSYLAVEQLGKACADVLPGRDYRTLKSLFRRRDAEPFTVSPRDARNMATVLTRAASHKRMPTAQAVLANKLAQSAQAAVDSRQPWNWS
jgi:hypothetical protein